LVDSLVSYFGNVGKSGGGSKGVERIIVPNQCREQYGSIIEHKVRSNHGMDYDGAGEPSAPSDPREAAIFAYNIEIISLTISNVEEARLADVPVMDEDGVGPPRPNIPGAY
jgi:hypothetical protein